MEAKAARNRPQSSNGGTTQAASSTMPSVPANQTTRPRAHRPGRPTAATAVRVARPGHRTGVAGGGSGSFGMLSSPRFMVAGAGELNQRSVPVNHCMIGKHDDLRPHMIAPAR